MKIGMNSQCMRVIEGDGIFDYHIHDGSTGTRMMKYSDGVEPSVNDFIGYERKKISSINDDMSWGTSIDKMTDITYLDINNRGEFDFTETIITNNPYGFYGTHHSPISVPAGTTSLPVSNPCMMVPPAKRLPRYDSQTEKNFKNLFGK